VIRATNHSSFPKVDDGQLDQLLRVVLARHARGRATDAELAETLDEITTVVVAQQSRAFIDVVTDGMVRWQGPLSHLAQHHDGMRTAGLVRWFDTNFHDRRVEIVGPIKRTGPYAVHDYEVAADVALKQLVKPSLPGPVTFARLATDLHYGGIRPLAEAVAAALAEEIADLKAAGATCFQIDEPLLCKYPEDFDLVADLAGQLFQAAGEGATTILSTYFGDLTAVADRLDRLPGTHLGLDMVAGKANFDLLDRLPPGKGVVLGLFDARSTIVEDADDVAVLLDPYQENLSGRDLFVAPNAGLELLPRTEAFDKLLHARYLVEKLTEEWTWPS